MTQKFVRLSPEGIQILSDLLTKHGFKINKSRSISNVEFTFSRPFTPLDVRVTKIEYAPKHDRDTYEGTPPGWANVRFTSHEIEIDPTGKFLPEGEGLQKYVDELVAAIDRRLALLSETAALFKVLAAEKGIKLRWAYDREYFRYTFRFRNEKLLEISLHKGFADMRVWLEECYQSFNVKNAEEIMAHMQDHELFNNAHSGSFIEDNVLYTRLEPCDYFSFLFRYGLTSIKRIRSEIRYCAYDKRMNRIVGNDRKEDIYYAIRFKELVSDEDCKELNTV